MLLEGEPQLLSSVKVSSNGRQEKPEVYKNLWEVSVEYMRQVSGVLFTSACLYLGGLSAARMWWTRWCVRPEGAALHPPDCTSGV